MENNKKPTRSHGLSTAMGFLGGVVVCAAVSITVMRFHNKNNIDPIAFETQGFAGGGNFLSNTTNNNGNNLGGNQNNPNNNTTPNTTTPNPTAPGAPTTPAAPNSQFPVTNPNSYAPYVSTSALAARNYIYTRLLDHPNNLNGPTCTVAGTVVTPNAPGVISFAATNTPQNAQTRCGLYNTGTRQFVSLANVYTLGLLFNNLNAGTYHVVCLTKYLNNGRYTSKMCESGPIVVEAAIPAPTIPVNPTNPTNPNGTANPNIPANPNGPANPHVPTAANPNGNSFNAPGNPGGNNNVVPALFDLQLRAGSSPVNAGQALTYFFKIGNNGPAPVSNFTLKVYPKGLVNINANGATLNGNAYVYTVQSLSANDGVAFTLEGFDDPSNAAAPSVVAELCQYEGMASQINPHDSNSSPCNMVNLVPVENDEAKA